MIIRHIPMKSARLSSFSSLINYITDEQNKQERLGKVTISNCHSTDISWAKQEVLAMQAKNQRAKGDKTYHLLISFAPGESPSEGILKAIEERVISSIGFNEHQRISAIHHDTDNLHIHIAINKIHPKTFNMIEPYRAYKAFAETASKLETEYGLKITNHKTKKNRSENLADDMEQHSGIESLINWIKRNYKSQIDSANSWSEVHQILSEHGLVVRMKANGLVFSDKKGLMVKASSVSRGFSKKSLESKLGLFKPSSFADETSTKNTYRYEPLNKQVINTEVYEHYLHEKEHGKATLSKKLRHLREAKARLIDKAKKRGRIKRATLKLMTASKAQKKYLYKKISNSLLKDIEIIRQNYTKERIQLLDLHQNKSWADWLQKKAGAGNKDALKALRSRNQKKQNNRTIPSTTSNIDMLDIKQVDSITKEGTEIYKVGNAVIRNNGKEIKVSKSSATTTLRKATKIDSHRQKITSEREKYSDQSRQYRFNGGRRASGSNEVAGAANRKKRKQPGIVSRAKPNAIITRQCSPAESKNCLRDVSQLDMVQLTRRSKMLLPDNAHDKLERQRPQPDNHVRRKASGIN